MKMRIIDADRIPYDMVMQNPFDEQSEKIEVIKKSKIERMPTIQAIPIPKDATNGDMIKAMFPYGKYGTNGNEVHVYGVGGNGCLVFTLDWWNAPYKRGSENESK